MWNVLALVWKKMTLVWNYRNHANSTQMQHQEPHTKACLKTWWQRESPRNILTVGYPSGGLAHMRLLHR